MAEYPVRRRIPTAHSIQIGRIITRWAVLEWRLRNTIYALLGIGPKEGRITVREQRAENYITTIKDLMKIKRISIQFDLIKYIKFLKILREHRNNLAHGIWLKHPDFEEPVLQLIKGKWNPDPSNPKTKTKRVIDPEGALIRPQELRQFSQLIDKAIDAAAQLEDQVTRALASSRQKSH